MPTEFIEHEFMIPLLREISPKVEDNLSTKMYLVDVVSQDDVSDEYLIRYCYRCIINEFEEIGLIFNDDLEELFSSYYGMSSIYYLRKYFDPKMIYESLKMNKQHNSIFFNILEDENTFDSLAMDYIEYLYMCNSTNQEIERLLELNDKIYNDDRLKLYFNNIIDELKKDQEILPDENVTKLIELTKTIQKERTYFKNAVLKVIYETDKFNKTSKDITYHLDLDYLNFKIRQYKLSLLNNENVNNYIWCLTVDKDTLSESLLQLWDNYMEEYFNTSSWCLEYWLMQFNNKNIYNDSIKWTYTNLVELCCNFYNPDIPKDIQIKMVDNLISKSKEYAFIETNRLLIYIDKIKLWLWGDL